MKKCFIAILAFLIVFIELSIMAVAHNGGLDELGGHFRNKDCHYLLHEPTALAASAANMEELILLIKKNNSNECKNTLTANKVDLEGFTFKSDSPSTTLPTSGASKESSTSSSESIALGKTYPATLKRCIDGDTAEFLVGGQPYNIRFLYIDTPESTREKEAYGSEAADFTCSFLKQGSITIETDGNTLFDKYDRLLAWVFVDDQLHQEVITETGLVEDFYDYGDYKYEDRIVDAMRYAREKKLGMYAELKSDDSNGDEEAVADSAVKEEGRPSKAESIPTEDVEMKEQNQESDPTDTDKGIPFVVWVLVIGVGLFLIIRKFS